MSQAEDVREECDFSGGMRGKYAAQVREGTNVILLDPDVAEVFNDAKLVNALLRSLLPVVKPGRQAS